MYFSDFFHSLPLAAIYIFSVLLVLGALALGILLGRRHLAHSGDDKGSSVGSAVAATLALLAFLLAFTFNMTADRFNQRKALLLNEVNAIQTTYLNARFLDSADTRRARTLLLEYVDLRDLDLRTDEITDEDLARSRVLHGELWRLVDRAIDGGHEPGYLRQFVEPLNTVINFDNSRNVVGLQYRIPGPIWLALYFMTALAMLAIGFQFGISRGGSPQVAVALALTFATVILLIADLDRTTEGFLLVDQKPMSELNRLLREAERGAASQ